MKIFQISITFLLISISVQAQMFYSPFGFHAFEKEDMARNKVLNAFEYKLYSEDQEFLPGDSLYLRKFNYHESGWLISEEEFTEGWDGMMVSVGTYFVYSGPGGLVSRQSVEYVESDSYEIHYEYNKQGILTKKSVVQIDPSEYEYENKKGVITTSKVYVTYPSYDDEGEFNGGVRYYQGKSDYFYNQKGQLTEVKDYSLDDDSKEHLAYINRFTYTAEGRLLTRSLYFMDEEMGEVMQFVFSYSYNSKNLLEKVVFESSVFDEYYILRYAYQYR